MPSHPSRRARHTSSVILITAALVPAGLALPVLAAPAQAGHPVAPRIQSLGLDALPADTAAADLSASTPAVRSALAQSATTATVPGGAAAARAITTASAPPERAALLSRPVATGGYSLVGVSWSASYGTDGVGVAVRTRRAGAWSGWQPLAISDSGPGVGSAEAAVSRDGTDPLLVDPSDGVQVRVDTPTGAVPPGLQVQLVDPGTSPADADLVGTPPASAASAAVAEPSIITRKQWGADESLRRYGGPTYMPREAAVFIHHTASRNTYTTSTAAADVRSIYAYDTSGLHWSDIAYNFLVDKWGRIYEGRAGGVDKFVKSAATGGANQDSFSVSALGNYATAAAPAAMVESIARVIAWKLSLSYLNPLGSSVLTITNGTPSISHFQNGQHVTFPVISPHRLASPTACPGTYLNAQVAAIRARVKVLMGPSLYLPSVSTHSVAQSALATAAPVRLVAGTAGAQSWKLSVYPVGSSTPVRVLTGNATTSLSASWDWRRSDGSFAAPGTYSLVLSSAAGGVSARPFGTSVSITAPPAPSPSPTPTPSPTGVTPAPHFPAGTSPVYTTSGYRTSAGTQWYTHCIAWTADGGVRCDVQRKGYYWQHVSTGYRRYFGWVHSIYTYVGYPTPYWASYHLAVGGTTTVAGHLWRTTCTPAATSGPRACTTSIWATQLVVTPAGTSYQLSTQSSWVPNSYVWIVGKPV